MEIAWHCMNERRTERLHSRAEEWKGRVDVTVTESAWAQEEEWEWICGRTSSITLNLSFLFTLLVYITLNLLNDSLRLSTPFSWFITSTFLYVCIIYTLNGTLQLTPSAPANISSNSALCVSVSCPSADKTSTGKKILLERNGLISLKHRNKRNNVIWNCWTKCIHILSFAIFFPWFWMANVPGHSVHLVHLIIILHWENLE